MDSLDLLAREDEFKKLNKQLEKKTESLMKEIEHVMQKQDIFADFSHSLSITPHSTPKRHICPPTQEVTPKPNPVKRKTSPKLVEQTKNIVPSPVVNESVVCGCCRSGDRRYDDDQFLQAFVSVAVQEGVLPKTFLKDSISVESICKFLSSKVKLMQEQIDRLQSNLDKKGVQCKSHLTQQAELEGERLSLLNKNNNLRAAAADAKAKSMAFENRLMEKDRLFKEQRSQCDKLSSEVKRLRGELAAVAGRHSTHEDTIASLTQQLKTVKSEHMEFRDSTRVLSSSHQQAISTLEARIKALTTTMNKQTELIDNLRRQNAILSSEGGLSITEKNYWNFLNEDL